MSIIQNVVISILILAGSVVGFVVLGKKPAVETEPKQQENAAAAVVTARVSAWNQPFLVEAEGEASTYRVVTVGAEVAGRIVEKSPAARNGRFVGKEDLLFRIDTTNYRLDVQRLSAELQRIDEQMQGTVVELSNTEELIKLAQEDVRLQSRQLERVRQLQSRRSASESEVDSTMAQELASRNALQVLQNKKNALIQQQKTELAGRALVDAQLARAKEDLARCEVKSPLEGRIVADVAEEGDYIKEGELLVQISDASKMEVKTKLRAEELAWVWQQRLVSPAGQQANDDGVQPPVSAADPVNLPRVPCEIAFEFEGVETIWDGVLAGIEGTGIDRVTRTFPCRVIVEEPQKTRTNHSAGGRPATSPPTLLSGMFVTIRIPVESPAPLLGLPIEAVRPGGQVWTVHDGALDILNVTVAHVEGSTALIRQADSGLLDGDRVIVSPLASVREGMLVSDAADSVPAPPRVSAAESQIPTPASVPAAQKPEEGADRSREEAIEVSE